MAKIRVNTCDGPIEVENLNQIPIWPETPIGEHYTNFVAPDGWLWGYIEANEREGYGDHYFQWSDSDYVRETFEAQ